MFAVPGLLVARREGPGLRTGHHGERRSCRRIPVARRRVGSPNNGSIPPDVTANRNGRRAAILGAPMPQDRRPFRNEPHRRLTVGALIAAR